MSFCLKQEQISSEMIKNISNIVTLCRQIHVSKMFVKFSWLFQVRSGCAFMVHVCQDEHQLYSEFFSKPTSKLEWVPESSEHQNSHRLLCVVLTRN